MPENDGHDISNSFSGAIGPSSPAQQALMLLKQVVDQTPVPNQQTGEAWYAAPLLVNHLTHLVEGADLFNGTGYHSAAVALFRPMEDALDCLRAVGTIPGAAEAWLKGKLRASDAAKRWTAEEGDPEIHTHGRRISLSEYRKGLRSQFNSVAHCSIQMVEWSLYFDSDANLGAISKPLKINSDPFIINKNAHNIDCHLLANLLDLIIAVKTVFSRSLLEKPDIAARLTEYESKLIDILQEESEHDHLDVTIAPEIRPFRNPGGTSDQ